LKVLRTALTILILLSPFQVPSAPAGATSTPFRHIIVVMQENHSFDNYFGTYPTANGTLSLSIIPKLARVNGIPDHVCLNYSGACVSPHLTTTLNPQRPIEGQAVYEEDYGSDSNFATSSGPQSMVYFDYQSIPGYWDYAEEYGLADNYFAAVLSTTAPNRLMLLAGDTPVSQNYGPPPFVEYSRTILGQLAGAGVSWGYFDLMNASLDPTTLYPLNYIAGLEASRSNIRGISSLLEELGSSSGLPSVSYVNFLGRLGLTEHPPFSPTAGEAQVISVVNAIESSGYWNSTAVFVTWDEGGGFYDHVQPPKNFTLNHGFTQALEGLGQRVPLLVISPYSKQDYVSDIEMSHLSLLHFIEYNWNLPPLDGTVATSNLPLDFFNFSQSPRPPLLLGTGVSSVLSYPIPLQALPRGPNSRPQIPLVSYTLASLALAIALLAVAGAILYSRSKVQTPIRSLSPRSRKGGPAR